MTTLTADAPPTVIRWPYLGYAFIAIGVMIVAITSHDRWFLNFVHVICGVMWTGIDLFMGFIVGPILRRVDISTRREVIVRLVPKTLFLMPTLAIITGTSGWYSPRTSATSISPGRSSAGSRPRSRWSR